MGTTTMWFSLAGILATNIALVIGAVWRMSGVIQKVISRLDSIKELMDLSNKHTEQRITAIEAAVALQNQSLVDIQKRQTSMELEMKLMRKD